MTMPNEHRVGAERPETASRTRHRMTISEDLMNTHSNSFSSLPSSLRYSALFCAVALFAATLSCSLDVRTGPASETQIVILQLTPTDVEANVGSIVDPSPAIRVKEMISGKPLVGATVEFRAGPGSGSIEKPFTTTDASGLATAGRWEVGTRPGDFTLTAIVANARTSFHVQIKPDVPARLAFDATKLIGLTGEVI